jgi:hypothetical protein
LTAASPTHRPSPVAVAPPAITPNIAPASTPTTGPPSQNPAATPYPVFFAVPVGAGPTQIVPAGPTPVRLTVTLPDGWERASEAMYVKPSGTAEVGLSIGAWSIAHVNTFPCRWSGRAYSDESVIHTAIGQAQALSDWWGQDPNLAPFYSNSAIAPIAIRPHPGRIAGRDAMYVTVLVPSVFDFTQCDAGQLVLWETADGHVRYGLGPTELNRIWVVDAGGRPIVIDASSPLTQSPADKAELQAVIDSIVIEP